MSKLLKKRSTDDFWRKIHFIQLVISNNNKNIKYKYNYENEKDSQMLKFNKRYKNVLEEVCYHVSLIENGDKF